jgi:hypothetical protein
MELDELQASLTAKEPPAGLSPLVQVLWHDAKGDWQRAHEIAQAVKGAAVARVHAYLHRKEGDLANADYWYGQAGAKRPKITLEGEWHELARELLREKAA